MIIDKTPLPEDPTPSEAPPAFQQLFLRPVIRVRQWLKRVLSISVVFHHSDSPLPSSSSAKGKGRAQWFQFGSKTSKDVKSTTLGLVRDLVREEFQSPAAFAILQSCAEACTSHGLSFSSILQEKSIEGHTPLYWAIVKRRPDETQDADANVQDLLTALLSHSAPLTQSTMSDVRHACLVTSDQPLFQRLRQSPDFGAGSAVDELLIGVTLPPDDVEVVNFPDDEGSFAVNIGIMKFQKRMMIAKNITIEFIARTTKTQLPSFFTGRMWKLAFFVVPENGDARSGRRPGSWCVSLSLMEHSPPTWVDSRVLIADPYQPATTKSKPKPTISMRLKSPRPLTAPPYRGADGVTEVMVTFEDNLMASSLQYSQSSYILPDEKLRARFEARLSKQETECIIC
ncbi:hypothetical protein NP233_g9949 [Leucocoprinus birnbaumii]|uniref:Uncharacterized protein n=1 Tax=Leucocoprinus birnbaumii TaxID=56174 RepID=A0AAD5VJH4_9AGAR|nr:hypothetical protein NP233_g9949 [Leucocoprinus birnbaumii]